MNPFAYPPVLHPGVLAARAREENAAEAEDRHDYPFGVPNNRQDGSAPVRDAPEGTEPKRPALGESRDLLTQSGGTVALAQEAGYAEGNVYTATFGVQAPSGLVYRAVARVTYSEGGNRVRRVVDVVRGASLTLPGRVFDVRVTDETPPVLPLTATPTPGAGSKYTVSVLIAPGPRPLGSRPPTLYQGIATIGAHGSETVAIPEDTGVSSVEVSVVENAAFPTVKPNVVVSFRGPDGASVFKSYDPTVETGFVAIPPGATEVVVTNADGANGVVATVTWGVDG